MNGINWEEAKAKLIENETALQGKLTITPERQRVLLRQRADRLLGRTPITHDAAPGQDYLIFRIDPERYAVELSELSAIIHLKDWTPLPVAPREYFGVINYRGEIRTIMNLRIILGMDSDTAASPKFVLMVNRGHMETGFCVDGTEEARKIAPDRMKPTCQADSDGQKKYVRAITDDGIYILHTTAISADLTS